MKRIVSVLLACVMFVTTFSGCALSKKEPLRICIDFASAKPYIERMQYSNSDSYYDSLTSFAHTFFNEVQTAAEREGVPLEYELEHLPLKGKERSEAIKRIREEIENGGGPDLFLIAGTDGSTYGSGALFVTPELELEKGTFLPLDKYIEKAERSEWNKFTDSVMAAGRNENGQQIIPLSYTLPLTVYDAAEVEHDASKDFMWEDMLEDESGVMRRAGVWTRLYFSYYGSYTGDYLQHILGQFADYSAGKILITEEELLKRTMELIELRAMEKEGLLNDIPKHYQVRLWSGFDSVIYDFKGITGFVNGEPVSMVPVYSVDGGVTAEIVSYAAVNANTKCAEKAFFVLDYLLSTEVQRKRFFSIFTYDGGIPLHEQMMSRSFGKTTGNGSMFTDVAFDELSNVRDQITYTRFQGGLDIKLDKMFVECERAYRDGEREQIADYVSVCYQEMQDMLKQMTA